MKNESTKRNFSIQMHRAYVDHKYSCRQRKKKHPCGFRYSFTGSKIQQIKQSHGTDKIDTLKYQIQ